MSHQRKAGKDPLAALKGLAPSLLTWLHVAIYLYLQPVILNYHLVPFVFFVGLVNAYSVGQIIIAHLTKTEFPDHNILVSCLGFAIIDSLGLRLGLWASVLGDGMYQVSFMFACLGLSVGVYGSFVVSTRENEPAPRWYLTLIARRYHHDM